MIWSAGQLLYGGRYVVERQLGAGGCGITYLAKDKKGSWVVLKTLKDEILTNPKMTQLRNKYQQDFRNEALRLSLCRHPHIVQIENAFYEGELPCIVMEYVHGQDLNERVNQRGVLSESEALRYIRQIGEALSVIHEKGLLHRDVKPENIMIRAENSEAVLIDFGIAREFVPQLTITHTQSLTPGFAPIEQYAPQARRGEQTDIYALAGTLYFLLTGQIPIPAPARVVGITLDPPKKINRRISVQVNQAILKGMEFQAEDRPQSVQEWLALLPFNRMATYVPTASVPHTHSPIETNQKNSTLQTTIPNVHRRSSAGGIDYRKLQTFLALGKWREADEETAAIMLKISNREKEGWLRVEDIQQFPTQDLRIIDQLWIKHSHSRFGFSVQKNILQRLGGNQHSNYETLCLLGDAIGWRSQGAWVSYDDFIFDERRAPVGHFPSGYVFCEVGWWVGLLNLFYQLED